MLGAGTVFAVVVTIIALIVIILWWWHSCDRSSGERANTQSQHQQKFSPKDSLEVKDKDEIDLELGVPLIEKPQKVYQHSLGRATPPNSWTRLDGKERPRIYEVPELGGRFVAVEGLNRSI